MAKELPFFRFTVQDWQNGKVSLESYEIQGLFINVCGYYWINDCTITLAMLRKKFSNAIPMLEQLIELGIIKHENRHDKVEIEFLNLQYDLLSEKRKRRQEAGSMGGNATAMLKQKSSYKYKDNNKDKDNSKDKFKPPEFLELKEYCKANGFESIAEKVFNYYSIADWKDANGKKVKNWKQKLNGVWFKPENKGKTNNETEIKAKRNTNPTIQSLLG